MTTLTYRDAAPYTRYEAGNYAWDVTNHHSVTLPDDEADALLAEYSGMLYRASTSTALDAPLSPTPGDYSDTVGFPATGWAAPIAVGDSIVAGEQSNPEPAPEPETPPATPYIAPLAQTHLSPPARLASLYPRFTSPPPDIPTTKGHLTMVAIIYGIHPYGASNSIFFLSDGSSTVPVPNIPGVFGPPIGKFNGAGKDNQKETKGNNQVIALFSAPETAEYSLEFDGAISYEFYALVTGETITTSGVGATLKSSLGDVGGTFRPIFAFAVQAPDRDGVSGVTYGAYNCQISTPPDVLAEYLTPGTKRTIKIKVIPDTTNKRLLRTVTFATMAALDPTAAPILSLSATPLLPQSQGRSCQSAPHLFPIHLSTIHPWASQDPQSQEENN